MVWQPLNLSAICPPNSPLTTCSSFGFVYLSLLVQLYGSSVNQKKKEMCDRERKHENLDGKKYDFIVVGAGGAGAVVANRLSANHKWKVLLLEAGGEEPEITSVPGFFSVLCSSSIDWQYSSEPNGKSCLAWPGARCGWPRGKTMGGSTAINALAYVRGNRADYDRWALMGNKGWSYKDVLPYFIKSETNMNKYALDSDYHGATGEQYISWLPYVDEPANMLTQAFNEAGIPFRDFNGEEQVGAMQAQTFTLDGKRVSTNVAFIEPIRYQRPNLVIETNSEAIKILIDDHKNAHGIVYVKDGKKYTAYAEKEVIVSGGVMNSPKLLMLSGIGPKKHLEDLNIPIIKDLPGVGENVQDHVSFNGILVALANDTVTTVSQDQILSDVRDFAKMKIKKGPLSGLGPIMSAAFIRTEPYLIAPDIQYQAVHIPKWREFIQDPVTAERAPILPTAYYDAVVPRVMNVVPQSRGKITLNKTNPHGPAILHANYLDDERDVTTLMKGIRFLLTLENTNAFKSRGSYFIREKMPHCAEHEWGTDEYFICLIRQYTSTTHHQSGGCKMGPKSDKKAVVDSDLRVYGVKWLRVIDNSIMPIGIRGNMAAATIMIAEKAVDSVIKYWQNRTNNYCF